MKNNLVIYGFIIFLIVLFLGACEKKVIKEKVIKKFKEEEKRIENQQEANRRTQPGPDNNWYNETEYKITDTGLWPMFRTPIFWLDDKAFVYQGFESGHYIHHDPRSKNKPPIVTMVWEEDGNRFYPLMEDKGRVEINCVSSEGYYYAIEYEKGKYTYHVGEFEKRDGQYSLVEKRKQNGFDGIGYIDNGVCSLLPKNHSKNSEYRKKYLEEIDGELHFYPDNKVKFLTQSNPEGVWLPIRRHQISLKYSKQFDAYYFVARQDDPKTNYPDGFNEKVYYFLLFNSGGYKAFEFPDHFKKRGTRPYGFYLTRGGAVYSSSEKGFKSDSINDLGLFVLSDSGELSMLIKGWLGGIKMSDDECRLAFDHFPRSGQRGWVKDNRLTLKIIDFCNI